MWYKHYTCDDICNTFMQKNTIAVLEQCTLEAAWLSYFYKASFSCIKWLLKRACFYKKVFCGKRAVYGQWPDPQKHIPPPDNEICLSTSQPLQVLQSTIPVYNALVGRVASKGEATHMNKQTNNWQQTHTSLEPLQWSTNDTANNSVTIKQSLAWLVLLSHHDNCLNMKEQQKKQEGTRANLSDSSYKRIAVTFLYFGEDFTVTSFRLSERSQDTHYSTICWSVSIALKA